MSNHYDFDGVKPAQILLEIHSFSKRSTREYINKNATQYSERKFRTKQNGREDLFKLQKKGERKSKNSSWCMLLKKERRNKNLVLRVFMFIFMF